MTHTFLVFVRHSHWDEATEKYVTDPTTEHEVTVEVDLHKIATRVWPIAVRSKSGKSKYMHGAVVVTAVR